MTTFHKIVEAKRLYFLSYHNDALSEVSVTFACFLLSNSVVLLIAGKKETEVKEVDKVMYHDWRLIPKHMEQQFKDFEPLPDPPPRYVPYPPLLRAMILAKHKKTFGKAMEEEPTLALDRNVVLNKDYFRQKELEKKRAEGTPV